MFLIAGAQARDEAATDGREQMDGDAGLESGQDAEGGAGDAEQLAVVHGRDVGRAGAVIDEGHLAEEIAGFESGKEAVIEGNPRPSGENDIHAVTGFADTDDALAGGEVVHRALGDEGLKFFAIQVREELELGEALVVVARNVAGFVHETSILGCVSPVRPEATARITSGRNFWEANFRPGGPG